MLRAGSNHDLPTWGNIHGNSSPALRMRSPVRGSRASATGSMAQLPIDRRQGYPHHPGSAARMPYVIATAHSPPPNTRGSSPTVQWPSFGAVARASSPYAGNFGLMADSQAGDDFLQKDRAWAFRPEAESQTRMGSGDGRSRAVSPLGLPTMARFASPSGVYPGASAQVR